jgi:glucosylceramidase
MAGFGAALTGSSAWLIQNKLSAAQRATLLRELFGPPPGLNFNMLRITIGASDFSLQHYTLDDMPAGQVDPQLQHFNVVVDQRDVIPVLLDILAVRPGLLIIASPWSAPAWMKASANVISGTLLEAYEATYADYLVRFVDAYKSYGIPIFALTVQNEPAFEPLTYPGMNLPAEARSRIIGKYLGPALAGRKPQTLILGWDHNWDAPDQSLSVLADPDAQRYIAGIAWHCYSGDPAAQARVHRAFPHKDTYLTECSGGDWPSARNGELLLFARNIVMESIRNWARGVIYWNLVLDENHGPHAGGCDECKGVVTIDSATGAISRNDEYYAFGHFSRFVLPGAVRVKSDNTNAGIHEIAFRNPDDGSVVLVAVNDNTQTNRLSVRQGALRFQYDLPASSVATFVWPSDMTAEPASAASSAR